MAKNQGVHLHGEATCTYNIMCNWGGGALETIRYVKLAARHSCDSNCKLGILFSCVCTYLFMRAQ